MKKAWSIFSGISTALFCLLILIAIGVAIGRSTNNPQVSPRTDSVPTRETSTIEEEPLTDSIAIPGFEHLVLKARTAEQEVNFYNPAKNTCYFEISLLLPDRTEVFHSGILAPGSSINSIKLRYTLEPGRYERAILRYTCYAVGSMAELNGADIVFNLEVVP